MYHTIIIVGNVGKDAEMRYTPSGQAVTSFTVATNREYTTKDEKVKETCWFRVTTWGKQAEVMNQYVKKGMKVLVEGILSPDKSTGGPKVFKKGDSSPGATYEVTASVVRFLSHVETNEQDEQDGSPVAEDDFPF